MSTHATAGSTELPAGLVPPFLVGATLALAGGFWDDSWHTERGRDSFFIAPHLAIYSGIFLAGAALALWALLIARRQGLAIVQSRGPLALALLSVTLTLGSAPIDNFWHVAFGRDAVIWSPPHVLGIVGTAGLTVAILVELQRAGTRWMMPVRWVCGALLVAALSFLVVEYDTDVPQFAVIWYLPVLALGSSFALGIVRLATGERSAATRTAAVHLGYFSLVVLFLTSQGFETPKAPLLIAAAVALDWSAERGLPLFVQAGLYDVALYALYVPALDLFGHGVRLGAGDVAVGMPLAFLAVLAVLAVISGRHPRFGRKRRALLTAAGTTVVLLVVAGAALAHDPGQGPPAGAFDFHARLQGHTLTVSANRHGSDCPQIVPEQLIARRAGRAEHGPLRGDGCRFTGTVLLTTEGRWFVYLDLSKQGRTVESWIPVKAGEGPMLRDVSNRFAYLADQKPATALKWTIGTLLYAMVLGFVIAITRLVRRANRPQASPAVETR
ncbi:MAG: hypothetical protein ACYC91_15855 [Solirubrobacteraceae bacterium]